ncbi:hypothetical protein BDV10DRAFT_154832 [Aspergillus recurvatus]
MASCIHRWTVDTTAVGWSLTAGCIALRGRYQLAALRVFSLRWIAGGVPPERTW